MNEGRLAYTAFSKLDLFLEGALDKELTSAIRGRALVGGLCMAIPLWGIEIIVYAVALWGMYGKVAQISTVPFKDHFWRNVGGAIAVNLIINFIGGMVLDMLPGIGWILSFALGYASITISGMAYIEALKSLHGKKSKSRINYGRGFDSMRNNSGFSKQTRSAINTASKYVDVPPIFNTPQNPTTPTSRASTNNTDKVKKLKDLKLQLDTGILTEQEFKKQMDIVLNS